MKAKKPVDTRYAFRVFYYFVAVVVMVALDSLVALSRKIIF